MGLSSLLAYVPDGTSGYGGVRALLLQDSAVVAVSYQLLAISENGTNSKTNIKS
jgi:hypothetical protein